MAMQIEVRKSSLPLGQAGMSFLDIVIGISIFAAAVMISMKLVVDINAAHTASAGVNRFQNVVAQINAFASNELSCRLAFGGPLLLGGPTDAAAQTLNLSTAPTNIKLFMPGASSGGSRVEFMNPDNPAANVFGAWTVTALVLTPLMPVAAGPAEIPVNLTLTMIRQGLTGPTTRISNTTNLTVVTDAANRIISCSGLNYGTSNGSSAFAVPICGPNEGMYSDGTRIGCRRIRCGGAYPTPLGGYDSMGNINCGP